MLEGGQASASAANAISGVWPDGPSTEQPPKRVAVEASLTRVTDAMKAMQEQQQQFMRSMLQQQEMQQQAFALAMEQLATAVASSGVNQAPSMPQPLPTPLSQPVGATAARPKELPSIPQELDAVIMKRTKSYKDSVFKLARAKSHKEKLQTDLDTLCEDGMKYPKSIGEFKSQLTSAELDLPLTDASTAEFNHVCHVPQGTSRRDALKIVHHNYCRFKAKVMLEAHNDHLAVLEPLADAQELEKIVKDVLEEASKPCPAESFGLPKPLVATVQEAAIQKRVNDIYTKIFGLLNKKLATDRAANEKSKEMRELADKALLKKTPDQLLSELVKSEVTSGLREHGMVPEMNVDEPVAPQASTSDFIHALTHEQGKGLSPPEVVGQNPVVTFVQPKPKQRALGRAGPYRSGKGKGWQTSGKHGGKKDKKGGKAPAW